MTTKKPATPPSPTALRFAQRVAMVRNVVQLNEEVDPSLVIRRLKQEIRDLRDQVGPAPLPSATTACEETALFKKELAILEPWAGWAGI